MKSGKIAQAVSEETLKMIRIYTYIYSPEARADNPKGHNFECLKRFTTLIIHFKS